MTEDQTLKADPVKTEPPKTSGLPETDRKRVLLGSVIGGGMFLGILIAIIVLVSTEEVKPVPKPAPKPGKYIPSHNPFIVESAVLEHGVTMNVLVYNNRTAMENSWKNQTTTLPGNIPVIRNTTENDEPVRVRIMATQMDEHLLRIRYTDNLWERWEVPDYGSHESHYARTSAHIRSHLGFEVLQKPSGIFEWVFHGKNYDMIPLLTTENCRFQYFDKYIEFEARLQTNYVFGMGQRIESFLLKDDNYSLWNRHYPYDVGTDPEYGMYGSHPFLLNRLKDGKNFVGLFMRNSNAMTFSLWHTLNNGTYINYKMIGGIVDLWVFHSADPDYILKKYHTVIGRPYLPPVWGMGLQAAKLGYTVKDFETIIAKHKEHTIPIDGLWADVDINQNYKTFTVDPTKFAGIKELVDKMHSHTEGIDMHFVAIANPGLKKEKGYKYYDDAVKDNALIKTAEIHEQAYEGRTMAGTTVWLDYFVDPSRLIWATGIHDMHEATGLDGIWISENEPNNICSGNCATPSLMADENDGIPNPFHNASEFDYLQYRPTIDHLDANTLPMHAYHYGNDMFWKQFNTHNLFSIQTAKATYEALYGIFEDKRFLVVSRSTWPGIGQFASSWFADNFATWNSMRASIPLMLNFNMFGIPHVGAPIGGYYGNVNWELLARWYELGCFYPLMLTHSFSAASGREVYAIANITDSIKTALMERYALIRFMYTKMFEAYAWGGAVVHPLFFEFPEDDKLYTRDVVDTGFMWAKTLYIIPSLIPGQTSTRAYLPNWRWYDLRTREIVFEHREGGVGDYRTFDQPLGYITVLIKGGSIIPYQALVRDARIMNTVDLTRIPARLIVAPDHQDKAIGSMIVDTEGIRPHPDPRSQTYRHYTFTYMNQIFRINKLAGFDFHEEFEFDYFYELVILDVFGKHQVDFVCMMDMELRKKELSFWHSFGSSALLIHDERMQKMNMANLETIVWGSNEQHDFCKFEVHLASETYEENGRVMKGELATSDPAAYQLKFDLTAKAITDQIVSLQISMIAGGVKNWIVPDVVDDRVRHTLMGTRSLKDIGFRTSPLYAPFAFEMSEPEDPRDFLFTSRYGSFVFVRNFIHIKFMANSRHIFGLGERVGKFELTDGIYSLWNYDGLHEETGLPPGNNMYGHHPFYLMHMHNPNEFCGVFFLNSNPIDVKIKHVGTQTEIDHVFAGGIVDAFFIESGPVEEVIKEYHYIIGRPTPLPFWAFGYHQSRWGYRDIEHLTMVVNTFVDKGIPLDGIWMDKDFMEHYRTFTVNQTSWYNLKNKITEWQGIGKHFVAIVDPSVAIDPAFDVYADGLSRGVYIMSNWGGQNKPLIGVTWPGYSVFIDFLNPSTASFWEEWLGKFHEKVPYDGLWLDMNEPSNFCDGECPDEIHYHYYLFPLDYYDDLYYNPTHRPLEKATVSMEATHAGDPSFNTEFNYHSMYGFYQARETARYFLMKQNRRPFIVTSSTFPGTGRYASHWLGDNYSSWHYMEYSIAGMFNFQLFGIPFVGADVCGFYGNTTVSLCSRWMQLGAFYPFMRNHNSHLSSPQEPYVDEKLMAVTKKALKLRYSLARYMYTSYMHTVLRGGTMVRPVLFDFPTDMQTYSILDTSFMFGPALRITPVLADKVDVLESYFPNADWYHYSPPEYKKVMSYNHTTKRGQTLQLHCSIDGEGINVHIRSGVIFPRVEIGEGVTTIEKARELPLELIIVPDDNLLAKGEIYYDTEHHTGFEMEHQDLGLESYKNVLTVKLNNGMQKMDYKHKDNIVNKITILGAKSFHDTVSAKFVTKDHQTVAMKKVTYNAASETLILEPPETPPMDITQVETVSWHNTTSIF